MAPDWPGFVQRAAGEAFRDPRIREACSSRYRSGIKFRRVRAAGRINRPDGTGPIDCLFNHLTCEFCCEFGGRIAACIPPPGGRSNGMPRQESPRRVIWRPDCRLHSATWWPRTSASIMPKQHPPCNTFWAAKSYGPEWPPIGPDSFREPRGGLPRSPHSGSLLISLRSWPATI